MDTLNHKFFRAWLVSEGRNIPIFAPKVEGNVVTCWVVAHPGQTFAIHWEDVGSKLDTASYIIVDGNTVPGKYLWGRGQTYRLGVRTSQGMERPFMFVPTDTSSAGTMPHLPLNLHAQIGQVTLKIRQMRRTVGHLPNPVTPLENFTIGMEHQFAVRVGLGAETKALPQPATTFDFEYLSPHSWVTFIFRYRSPEYIASRQLPRLQTPMKDIWPGRKPTTQPRKGKSAEPSQPIACPRNSVTKQSTGKRQREPSTTTTEPRKAQRTQTRATPSTASVTAHSTTLQTRQSTISCSDSTSTGANKAVASQPSSLMMPPPTRLTIAPTVQPSVPQPTMPAVTAGHIALPSQPAVQQFHLDVQVPEHTESGPEPQYIVTQTDRDAYVNASTLVQGPSPSAYAIPNMHIPQEQRQVSQTVDQPAECVVPAVAGAAQLVTNAVQPVEDPTSAQVNATSAEIDAYFASLLAALERPAAHIAEDPCAAYFGGHISQQMVEQTGQHTHGQVSHQTYDHSREVALDQTGSSFAGQHITNFVDQPTQYEAGHVGQPAASQAVSPSVQQPGSLSVPVQSAADGAVVALFDAAVGGSANVVPAGDLLSEWLAYLQETPEKAK